MKRTALALLLALGLLSCDGTGKIGFDSDLDGQPLDLASSDGATPLDAVADVLDAVGVPDADISAVDAGEVLADIGTDAVDVEFQDIQIPDDVVPDSLSDAMEDLSEEVVEDTLVDSSPDIDVPPGCCMSDDDCSGSQECVGGLEGYTGVCKVPPTGDECWWFTDCAPGKMCQGASVCPCGAMCFVMDQTGKCVDADPSGCCFIDSMCANGEICVGGGLGGFPGTCVLAPEAGQCWEDEECPTGQICQGANWCSCMEVCDAMQYYGPGQCSAPSSCLTGAVDQQGVGTLCDTNPDACDGLVANMCSMGVFADPSLPPFCTHYCNAMDTCAEGSFCFPAGWSSSCVPDSCVDAFLDSCVSNIDCVVATQWDTCCPCPEIKTRAQVEMDPCLVEGSNIPSDLLPECVVYCPYDLCEECQTLTEGHCESYKCLAGPGGS